MTKIAGRYEITATLGQGGMGVVYRAYDAAPMDREVAVKTLHEFSDPLALDLFYKECRALKSISHPNIIEIFDMGEFEDGGHKKPFFVMPLLQGQTLDELIRNASHRLTVDRVVEIISQTCRGLQAAHERGLVHRDLKPSNIFVMADDSVKIIDFGVAHVVLARSRTSGFDKGTLLYMAPEQVQHKPVSVQSDIYSLGVTAYEALTRRQPFRGSTEDAVVQSILSYIPPPASELNSTVSHLVSRVIHKALAKQPWNRYDSIREFGETLQKALRNEPIALFDPARMQPRIQTATKALEKGDHQFAGEIVGELEAEGNLDPQIALLRTQIDQITRRKTVAQLLDSARARYEEEEDPLALQKLQEVLNLDPTNVAALGLKKKIDDRRSERQMEKWLQLARQHVDNHSYAHAHEALNNALQLRPKDTRASRLLKEIEGEEEEYVRLREEKSRIYQAAVNAWKNGEVSQALSQMKRVLDLDRRAPDTSSSDTGGMYQSFYDQIRSEYDVINQAYAEARRLLADKEYARALESCDRLLAKYPGHALFQAIKFDVEEHQRQELSAFIADIDRRLDLEPDLDAKVSLLHEAVSQYPQDVHFARLAKTLEDKRDLVNSIVERARLHEARGEFTEALGDLETLQAIHEKYPGLGFEKERLQKRFEQHTRQAARAKWVRQIDQQLETWDFVRAGELADKALIEYPDDAELAELRRSALQGVERTNRADQLLVEGEELCAQGNVEEGIARLEQALELDERSNARLVLRDVLLAQAQKGIDQEWRAAGAFAERALELDPNHPLAKSLRAQALDLKREELVDQCVSKARRLQAAGDINAAIAEVQGLLALYPGDSRLCAILDALEREGSQTKPRWREQEMGPSASHRGAESASGEQQAPQTVERTWVTVPFLRETHAAEPPTVVRPPAQRPKPRPSASAAPSGESPTPVQQHDTARASSPADREGSTQSHSLRRIRWADVITVSVGIAIAAALIVTSRKPVEPVIGESQPGQASSEAAGVTRGPEPTPDPHPAVAPAGTSAPATSPRPVPNPVPVPAPVFNSTPGGPATTATGPGGPRPSPGTAASPQPVRAPPVLSPRPSIGATSGVGDPAAQATPPAQALAAEVARAAFESAARSEAAGDWPAALQQYENAVRNDAGQRTTVDSAIARVKARMKADGTVAFQNARQYDALDRLDDAILWYDRAFRNLPEGDANRRIAGERLDALRTRK